jgi:Fe-S oxidoreductase/FAD/FMN-containing dehydrogenase
MGGIIGNNATGAHSIVYGMTCDHTLAVDAVLSDGSRARFDAFDADGWQARGKRPGLEGAIYRAIPGILERSAGQIAARYPRTFRHVAGYNLHKLVAADHPNLASLLVGSEGTLGITIEATLNCVRPPGLKRLALVHFSELRAALEAVPVMLKSDPSAIELLDRMLLGLTRDKIEYRRLLTFVEGDPEIVLIVEYAGEAEGELDAGITRLREKLAQINHRDPVVIVSDPVQQANVWFVRKVGLGILMSVRGDAKPIPFIEDAAVPVEHLADYITQIVDVAHQAGVERVAMYAHASAGCIHVRPLIDLKTADGVRQLHEIGQGSLGLVLKYGGTISGEHGQGFSRSEFSEPFFGPELVQAFREVKAAFDPAGIMNPGKIIDAPRMNDESLLRMGTGYAVPLAPPATRYDFESDGGFARAVEMCNGAGVCRKLGQGVMCPTFMVTRDETHSTRGRANALRSAMMGLLGPEGMTSRELYRVMELCLSCKACKNECPSVVDMAKLKAEFLYGYYREHGTPLRARLLGRIAALNRLGQPFWPLTNALLAGPGRWALTALGVHPERPLPRLAPQTFTQWYRQHKSQQNRAAPASQKPVVLFHDTFMQHNDPQIGQAAVKVLEAAGYDVIVLEQKKCCGRPAMSKGMLDEAARLAKHNIALLAPYAEQGIPIVGCEPSCVAALVDEYPDLVPGPQARAAAGMSMMIETFLAQESEAGRLKLRFDSAPRKVLLHGHCHQKALFSTAGTHAMLKLIPNCAVEEVESGCCGMAGAFGYETEHYEMSIALSEMYLAPTVRSASPETIIAAPGTSCREQIAHTTNRRALHPIEVLAAALVDGVDAG